jgi:hypothetical protein
MGLFISATIYAWLSHAIGALAMPWSMLRDSGVRAVMLWVVAAAALFLLPDPMVSLLFIGFALLVLSPSDRTARLAFFFVAVPCAPFYLTANIPFPGLNHLTALTHYKLVVLIILVPLLFYAAQANRRLWSPVMTALLCFALYTTIIITAHTSVTGGIRFFIDQLLIYVLPLLAISAAIHEKSDVDACLKAFLMSSILLASVTLVSTFKQWDFYWIVQPVNIFTIPDLRAGFVRINATANTHSLAYHLGAGLIVLQYLQSREPMTFIRLNGLRALLLCGMYFTDSRGAMVGVAIAAVLYGLLVVQSTVARRFMMVLAAAAMSGLAFWLVTYEFPSDGRLGSFTYRQELLRTSLAYIADRPLFGDYLFYENIAFNHLLTGQGIVDITNLYLQIALPYGCVGLVLLMSVFATAIYSSVRHLPKAARLKSRFGIVAEQDESETRQTRARLAVTISILCGWLFLVTTTSDVALTMYIGLIFAAMALRLADLSPVMKASLRPRLSYANR